MMKKATITRVEEVKTMKAVLWLMRESNKRNPTGFKSQDALVDEQFVGKALEIGGFRTSSAAVLTVVAETFSVGFAIPTKQQKNKKHNTELDVHEFVITSSYNFKITIRRSCTSAQPSRLPQCATQIEGM